jgi:hypothetical protein
LAVPQGLGQLLHHAGREQRGLDLGFRLASPEVPSSYRGRPASELRTFVVGRINALYAPSSVNDRLKRADVSTRREWICYFAFTPADIGGTA